MMGKTDRRSPANMNRIHVSECDQFMADADRESEKEITVVLKPSWRA